MNEPRSPVTAYIGVGSNLNDPKRQVETAIRELAELPATRLRRVSSQYASSPMGPADQPDYINAVAELLTRLGPHELLDQLHRLEALHQRVRGRHWGPRTLDLDLLLYGSQCVQDERLRVPHEGLALRAFVILPLLEIAPRLSVPGLGKLRDLGARINVEAIRKLPREVVQPAPPSRNLDSQ